MKISENPTETRRLLLDYLNRSGESNLGISSSPRSPYRELTPAFPPQRALFLPSPLPRSPLLSVLPCIAAPLPASPARWPVPHAAAPLDPSPPCLVRQAASCTAAVLLLICHASGEFPWPKQGGKATLIGDRHHKINLIGDPHHKIKYVHT